MSDTQVTLRPESGAAALPRTVAEGTTAGDLLAELGERDVVAARIGGELRDLAQVLADGDTVEPVLIGSPDGRSIMRHSCAHVLAQAVQECFPEAKLGIGPPVRDGFYYDFDVDRPFTPEICGRSRSGCGRSSRPASASCGGR